MPLAAEPRPQQRDSESIDLDKKLQARSVARRYDISVRTLDRWLLKESLRFPRPAILIHDATGRVCSRLWNLRDLIAWERGQATKSAQSS